MSLYWLSNILMAITVVGLFLARVVYHSTRLSVEEHRHERDMWRDAVRQWEVYYTELKAELEQTRHHNRFVPAVIAQAARCQHPKVEDVITPALLGEPREVVARICTNPECYEQLPADFEPKSDDTSAYETLSESFTASVEALGRSPLILTRCSGCGEPQPPGRGLGRHKPDCGFVYR